MATTRLTFEPEGGQEVAAVAAPELKSAAGTNMTVKSLAFDAAAIEAAQWSLAALLGYGSGNLTVKVRWYADTATSNAVVWGVSIMAVTPGDAQDAETEAWATEATATGSASATAQAIVETSVTVTSLDSLAALDLFRLRLRRLATDGSDTMAGDAQVVGVLVEFSDT